MPRKSFVVNIGGADARRDLDRAKAMLAESYTLAGLPHETPSDAQVVRLGVRMLIQSMTPHQAYRIEADGRATPISPEEATKEAE